MAINRSRVAIAALMFAFAVGGRPLRGQACDLFVAALAAVRADSSNTILVDHTMLGVPQFAFRGYTSVRRGDTALARVVEPQLRSLNRERQPIPTCLAAERHWKTIADSALIPVFQARDGWTTFRARYGTGSQFALVSRPLIVGDTATIIVAIASGDLDGRGMLLQFVRDAAGNWIKRSEAQLWIS
jgi:hypothetical protein